MTKKVIKLPKPLDYQKEIIDWLDQDDVKYVAFRKSRQSGGSFLNKMLCSKWALEQKNVKIGYVTPTLKLGKLFYGELTRNLAPFITSSNGTDLIINFNTGSNVQFFSAEQKESVRGFQFHYLIVDEAAFISDDFWNFILKATVMIIGRKIVMCSTPCGSQGFFYQYVSYGLENQEGYKVKSITIYDNPFISIDEIEKIKHQVPQRVWQQEYLAEFISGVGSVFTNYEQCIVNNPIRTTRVLAAIDWAKTEDFTVLTIMSDGPRPCVLYRYRVNKIDYTQQVKIIAGKLNEWKPALTISEENNIGTVVNELLKKEYKGHLRCVNLDNSLKKEIIEDLVVAFEQKSIGIDNDEVLLRELQAFTVTYNPNTQSVKYAARVGMHDDTVISLAYAYHLAKNKVNKYSISIV